MTRRRPSLAALCRLLKALRGRLLDTMQRVHARPGTLQRVAASAHYWQFCFRWPSVRAVSLGCTANSPNTPTVPGSGAGATSYVPTTFTPRPTGTMATPTPRQPAAVTTLASPTASPQRTAPTSSQAASTQPTSTGGQAGCPLRWLELSRRLPY